MPSVIYSMTQSLDGFIAGPEGEIDWSAPDEELHRFHNERVREIGAQFCGRRLYEEMLFWETAEENPSAAEHVVEFARIWKQLPKIVFSTTLEKVEGNARLAGAADSRSTEGTTAAVAPDRSPCPRSFPGLRSRLPSRSEFGYRAEVRRRARSTSISGRWR